MPPLSFLRLPRWRERNIALYYLITASMSSFFIAGNWVFFWTRYMTFGQLGIMDATVFAFGMFMEIPTGAVADMLGRKKTMVAGALFCLPGIFTMAAADSMWALFAGFMIASVGWAFFSGATDAMAYETLKEKGQAEDYDKVVSAAHMLGLSVTICTTLIGGLLYEWHYRAPHYAWAMMYFFALLAALALHDPQVKNESPFSLRAYGRQLGEGVRQLWQPRLRPYLGLLLTANGVYVMFVSGLVAPAMSIEFGFDATEQSVIFAALGLMVAVLVLAIPWLRRTFSDFWGLFMMNAMLALAFLLGAAPIGAWGIAALFLIRLAGNWAGPWGLVVVNHAIPSEARATTLSTVSFLVRLPYVLTASLAGYTMQQGIFPLFSLGVGLVIVGVCVLSLAAYQWWGRAMTAALDPYPTREIALPASD
jgi:MFS family permease